ncbi:CopG family transcriptional regulator [Ciceribacter sp. RN22]|uniref:CopG family transcriptional regulator n=1 Tax=Ciceribacter sp. RN22 TaxID=2954932 RepID=UPI0035B1D5CD
MATKTRVLTAHVPLALAAWVDQEEEERHGMTLQALEDVRASRVIDRHVIRAWADSLGTDEPLFPPAR